MSSSSVSSKANPWFTYINAHLGEGNELVCKETIKKLQHSANPPARKEDIIHILALFIIHTFGQYYKVELLPLIENAEVSQIVAKKKTTVHTTYQKLSSGSLSAYIRHLHGQVSVTDVVHSDVRNIEKKCLENLKYLKMPLQKIKNCPLEEIPGSGPLLKSIQSKNQKMVNLLFDILEQRIIGPLNAEQEQNLQSFLFSKTAVIELNADHTLTSLNWISLLEKWSENEVFAKKIRGLYRKIPLYSWYKKNLANPQNSPSKPGYNPSFAEINPGMWPETPPLSPSSLFKFEHFISMRQNLLDYSIEMIEKKTKLDFSSLEPSFVKNLQDQWRGADEYRLSALYFALKSSSNSEHENYILNDKDYASSHTSCFIKAYFTIKPLIDEDESFSKQLIHVLFQWSRDCSEADRKTVDFEQFSHPLLLGRIPKMLEEMRALLQKTDVESSKYLSFFYSFLQLSFRQETAENADLFLKIMCLIQSYGIKIDEETVFILLNQSFYLRGSEEFSLDLYFDFFQSSIPLLAKGKISASDYNRFCLEAVQTLPKTPFYSTQKRVEGCIAFFKSLWADELDSYFCNFLIDSFQEKIQENFISYLQLLNIKLVSSSQKSRLELTAQEIYSLWQKSTNIYKIVWSSEALQDSKLESAFSFITHLEKTYRTKPYQTVCLFFEHIKAVEETLEKHTALIKKIEGLINHPLHHDHVFDWLSFLPHEEKLLITLEKLTHMRLLFNGMLSYSKIPKKITAELDEALLDFESLPPTSAPFQEAVKLNDSLIIRHQSQFLLELSNLIYWSFSPQIKGVEEEILKQIPSFKASGQKGQILRPLDKRYPYGKTLIYSWDIEEYRAPSFLNLSAVNFFNSQLIYFKIPLDISGSSLTSAHFLSRGGKECEKMEEGIQKVKKQASLTLASEESKEDVEKKLLQDPLIPAPSASSKQANPQVQQDFFSRFETPLKNFSLTLKHVLQLAASYLSSAKPLDSVEDSPRASHAIFVKNNERINFELYASQFDIFMEENRDFFNKLSGLIINKIKSAESFGATKFSVQDRQTNFQGSFIVDFDAAYYNTVSIQYEDHRAHVMRYEEAIEDVDFATYIHSHICMAMFLEDSKR